MELVHISDQPVRSIYGTTGGEFTLTAGDSLEIRRKVPATEVLLEETVPEGKQWSVRIHAEIIETEA